MECHLEHRIKYILSTVVSWVCDCVMAIDVLSLHDTLKDVNSVNRVDTYYLVMAVANSCSGLIVFSLFHILCGIVTSAKSGMHFMPLH